MHATNHGEGTGGKGGGGGGDGRDEVWTVRRLLGWIAGALEQRGVESSRALADLLVSHVLGCERMGLYTHPERVVADDELDRLRALVRRALKHEPIQYLTGEAWFLGMKLRVDQRVLIPRPATEGLVEELLQDARRRGLVVERSRERAAVVERAMLRELARARADAGEAPERGGGDGGDAERGAEGAGGEGGERAGGRGELIVADVGTGSGAIALAVLSAAMNARVLATDVSGAALEVARANAASLGLSGRLALAEGDLLGPVRAWLDREGLEGVDYLASNPPYIPDGEWEAEGMVGQNVKGHEPEGALRGGADGLRFVRPLLEGAPGVLREGGMVLVEVAASTAEAAARVAEGAGLRDVRVVEDLEGLPRVVVGRG
ncbi:MAG: N5-glutamine methyltransferase family protein [Phycisphaerales bacterium]